MARSRGKPAPTHYEILQVHHAAPLDLITAVYWRLASLLQSSRESDRAAEMALYHLTRSYQVLADRASREAYDRSLGIDGEQPAPRVPFRRRAPWLAPRRSSRKAADAEPDVNIDYYELLRLDPRAHPGVVGEAYPVMRNHYLRLVERSQAPPELIGLFEEAREVISDPARRRAYDETSKKQRATARAESRRKPPSTTNGNVPAGKPGANQRSAAKAAGESKTKSPAKKPRAAKTVAVSSPTGAAQKGHRTPREEAPERDDVAAALGSVISLAMGSASVLGKGGRGSIILAKRASQLLRDLVRDVEPEVAPGPSPDEENRLLQRLSRTSEATPPSRDQLRRDDGNSPLRRPSHTAEVTLPSGDQSRSSKDNLPPRTAAATLPSGSQSGPEAKIQQQPRPSQTADAQVPSDRYSSSDKAKLAPAHPSQSAAAPPVNGQSRSNEEDLVLGRLSQRSDAKIQADGQLLPEHPRLLARLTLTDGSGPARVVEISTVPFTLGENVSCNLVLPGLASEQARLLHQSGQFVLYGLADEPATRLHGDSISWAMLKDGDSFEIGPYKFRLDSASRNGL